VTGSLTGVLLLTPGVAGTAPPSQTTAGTAQRGDAMARVLSLMDQSQQRLVTQLDAGDQTQDLQQGVIDALDDAILLALMSATSSATSPSSSGPPRETSAESPHHEAAAPGDQPDRAARGRSTGTDPEARPRGRGGTGQDWGNLPPRERDEIMQGARDRVLEEYREQIERYYRALAEREGS